MQQKGNFSAFVSKVTRSEHKIDRGGISPNSIYVFLGVQNHVPPPESHYFGAKGFTKWKINKKI